MKDATSSVFCRESSINNIQWATAIAVESDVNVTISTQAYLYLNVFL